LGQTGWIWCVHFEKLNASFFAPPWPELPSGAGLHEFCRPKPKLRKHTKHEFWVKRGGLGAFVSKKSTTSFFAPQVARTASGRVSHEFCRPKPKLEKAPNMSFGSNGVDWVRSFRKAQRQVFSLQPWPELPSGRVSHEFCRPKPKLRKHTKHEFWVKWGGSGAFVSKTSTEVFSLHPVARTALGGGFRTRFVDRNRNCENTPNMSFGSNGVDWERSLSKKSTASFFAPQMARTTLGGGFARGLSTETETAKTHQTRVLGPTGGLGAFIAEKINYKFFRFNHSQTAPGAGFARVLSTETETSKTH
jgi:hypothetical protein